MGTNENQEINQAMLQFEPLMSQIGQVFSDFDQSLDQNQCRRRAACPRMTSDVDGTKWTYRVNLTKYPTEPNELHITMKDGTLTLSGKSEVTDENDFKVFSTHVWSKEIQVPARMKKDTLKAKLDDKNQLTLTADLNDNTTEINVNLTTAEMG